MTEATGPSDALDLVRRHYDRTAPKYDRQSRFFDFVLFGGGREWACSQAEGDVLELAVGTGLSLPHYPLDTRITGIDVSAPMLELARRRAAALDREVDLRVGDAQALDFPDERFDTVTCTIALCTIPDDGAAVAEALRVLRPGGRFILVEHVRSPLLPIRLGQRALEPLFLRLEQDHLLREPLDHVTAVGFQVERFERRKLGIVERLTARKPL